MLTALALLVVQAAPAPAADVRDVQVRIPKTFLHLSFDIAAFEHDPRLETRLSAQFGERALTAGSFHGANITVFAEKNEQALDSKRWRDAMSHGEPFEVGATACTTLVQAIPGDQLSMVHFNAYPVAAGYAFDVHVSGMRSAEGEAITRAEFEGIVRSVRVQFVRRGFPEDLPDEVRAAMTRSLCAWPKWREPLDIALRANKDDVHLAFSLGELLRFAEAPKAEIAAAHARAGELFRALEAPTRPQNVAWILCEESRGLAYLTDGKVQDALPHFRRARDLAQALGHEAFAGVSYNLACTCARLGRKDEALTVLADAIAKDERYRETAAKDSDLASLVGDARFEALLRKE